MRIHLVSSMMGALSIVCGQAFAAAPAPLQQTNMSLAMANALVDATMSACHAKGRSAVAVVIDRGGHVLSLQRDDSVGPHNTDAARKKAFTALSTKTLSSVFAQNARQNPESSNLNTIDSLLLIGGGVPVRVGDEVIGAIGVGGAGGSSIDESCALQAIENVLGKSSR